MRKEYPILVLDKDVSPDKITVLGMIHPTFFRIYQEENGRYDISIEIIPSKYENIVSAVHPLKNLGLLEKSGIPLFEKSGKKLFSSELNSDEIADINIDKLDVTERLKALKVYNCLYVPVKYHGKISYQIFRINYIRKVMNSSGTMRYIIETSHIFYDMAYKVIPDEGHVGIGLSGAEYTGFAKNVFNKIMKTVLNAAPAESRFSYNCTIPETPDSTICFEQREQINLVRALLDGGESFIGRISGNARLYRNNFYFSVCPETEHCIKSSRIVYSETMTSIDFTEDWSDCCTNVYASDNYGHFSDMGVDAESAKNFPRRIEKRIKFEYPEHLDEDEVKEQFKRDCNVYLNSHKTPKRSITVTFADIENNSMYEEFNNLQNYEVGDFVKIHHKELDIDFEDLEIISKEYDGLEQKTVSLIIGDFLNDGVHEIFYDGVLKEV